jgi:hypothetical protein
MARRNREVPGGGTTGPLAPFADDYEMKLRARGYSARSVTSELRHVARLSRWLEERQLSAADLSKERLEEFLGELPRRRDGGRVCSRRVLAATLSAHESAGFDVHVLAGLGGDVLTRGGRAWSRRPSGVRGLA